MVGPDRWTAFLALPQRASSDMPSTTDEFQITLRDGDLPNPPPEGKCLIDDLPNELLSYVFQLGVEVEQEWDEDSDFSNLNHVHQWEYINDSDRSVNSSDSISSRAVTDLEDDQVQPGDTLPFQVLVSHVSQRWRSVALDTHRSWTTLTFCVYPGLVQAKEYISRSNSLPLTIELDCYTDDYAPDDLEELSDVSEDEKEILSFEELDQILDLLEPAISQWGTFIFYASSYTYVHFLLSRLDKFGAAPCLESFQVYRYKIWDGTVLVPAKDTLFAFQWSGSEFKGGSLLEHTH